MLFRLAIRYVFAGDGIPELFRKTKVDDIDESCVLAIPNHKVGGLDVSMNETMFVDIFYP